MRLRFLLAAAVAAAPLLVAVPSAHAACTTGTKTVVGSISGQDRRFVDALIGFDVLDSSGRHLGAKYGDSSFGCAGQRGYGLTLRVNGSLPATGSTTSGTKSWKAVLPANATHMWIEVYPQAAGYGGTDESRYGHTMRRKIPVPYGATVNLRLPLICSQGGSTGVINGFVSKGGVRVAADRVAAWSLAPDNNTPSPILGFNVGYAKSNGYYAIPNLPSGQTYTVQITKSGVMKQYYNVRVNSCAGTYLGASF
ncbi:MAG TPA: hypothetical protein VFQ85_00735 [Mycobacteriales bacterium]|jgi:hypothetical protein|nr:hypothetical protein [Mycobacteriales bacterium]